MNGESTAEMSTSPPPPTQQQPQPPPPLGEEAAASDNSIAVAHSSVPAAAADVESTMSVDEPTAQVNSPTKQTQGESTISDPLPKSPAPQTDTIQSIAAAAAPSPVKRKSPIDETDCPTTTKMAAVEAVNTTEGDEG